MRMRRALLAAIAVALLGGCIRFEFDHCAEEPPHPECRADAGPDASAPDDAAIEDAAIEDAATP